MIQMPSGIYERVGTICSTDPGTSQLGFGVLHYDVVTLELLQIQAMTFKSAQMMDNDSFIIITHSERMEKILAQKNNLLRQFLLFKPNVICSESPFYNRLFPGAYGPLVESVFAIRYAAIEYNPSIRFHTYEPSVIKKAVGTTPGAKKDLVKAAILSNAEICNAYSGDLSDLDEHSLDAIGVAYTHLQRLRREVR
jgi:Holliday junction resolvasome RuvABC endonuclease subunit